MDPLHLKPIGRDTLANLFSSATFRVLFFVSCVVTVLLVPVSFWAFDNTKPYIFYSEGSYILPINATGNDQMIVSWKVHVNRHCPGVIRRELFDPRVGGAIIAMYDAEASLDTIESVGDQQINRTFLLPRAMPAGRTAYRAKLEYWCNPLQRLWPTRYTTPSLEFEVRG